MMSIIHRITFLFLLLCDITQAFNHYHHRSSTTNTIRRVLHSFPPNNDAFINRDVSSFTGLEEPDEVRSVVSKNEEEEVDLYTYEGDEDASPRWYGNWKPSISKLSDIPKSKKHSVTLIDPNDGETKVYLKKNKESLQHVLTKAIIWKLFKEEYGVGKDDTTVEVELNISDKDYLPDVVIFKKDDVEYSTRRDTAVFKEDKKPIFWGESGRMKIHKAVALAERYPDTDICQIRWGMELDQFVPDTLKAVKRVKNRTGKFSFGSIPKMEVWEYFNEEDGTIRMTKDMITWHHHLPDDE